MRFQRPDRVDFARLIADLEDSGLSRAVISKISGLSRHTIENLSKAGRTTTPLHYTGAVIVDLHNWRMNHINKDKE